uniref:Glycosyl transferase CAP10 domain-containing protein n=1 Tax=Eutreptiella gymnastica TaxID=73025 RepID=A0A7S1INI2_9EUGL|mmetsp:Transcript_29705/g.53328  ORF Transcript_29705/g.53328 Transcript_29705/m.53328 type:complete len:419 (+) Transcript_29705:71-1327(+)
MEPKFRNLVVGCLVMLIILAYMSSPTDPRGIVTSRTISGTTGLLFRMQRTRQFPMHELRKSAAQTTGWKQGKQCAQWAVSTTIWEPSKTLKQIAKLKTWCIVVVLDKKTPLPFEVENAVILGVEDQLKLPYRIARRLPWNHFGRKNVGFMYAVAHGAEVIYDCDDDNELIIDGNELESIPTSMQGEVLSPRGHPDVFNPYPMFGNVGGWPRGYPLDQILNKTTYESTEMENVVAKNNFYVHQSLANHDPDYDAIYRLTRPLPVTFTPGPPVALPPGTFCPYNAQATLHLKPAFWGMLLPITVHGRVSDIWRSYITQRILWDIGGRIVFRSPWVVQYRNAHNYLADFDSEYDLYKKATALVQYLKDWNSDEKILKRRLLQLCVDLYEREIFEQEDVLLMNDWLHDLGSAGYEFPLVTST